VSDGFQTEIPVRYSDIDSYGHVNNATYATYLEEARIDYLEAVLGTADLTDSVDDGRDADHGTADRQAAAEGETDEDPGASAIGMVVANLEIDFRRSIQTADAVTVTVTVAEMGTSSVTLEYEIRSAEGVHATARTTMVAFDRQARESRPLPDDWRAALETFESLRAE